MLIKEFFANQEIFITGGSGFIGKALIEKLLRSCPKVGKIFVLMRGKKNKTPEDRLQDILKTSIFNRLREEDPHILSKIHAIEGDCSELGLGIKAEDLLKLRNVTIIYHSAASVRFDTPLNEAIILNTRGTFELVKIAQTLKRLQVFVHVSTIYCNVEKHVVEEQVYPAEADWRTSIKLAETYSTETMNILTKKYTNNYPNTYTFTKRLSEQIINEYKDTLPMIIFRPAIVISAVDEPVRGWNDNFNGPLGMIVASGFGVLRICYCNPSNYLDIVPIDVVVRAMVVATYKKALEGNGSGQNDNKLDAINCTIGSINPITIFDLIETCRHRIMECPFEKALWVPGGVFTQSRVRHYITLFWLQIIPTLFLDSAMVLAKTTPFLMKIQRIIFSGFESLHYFMSTAWDFKNEHFLALDTIVPETEIETFGFVQLSKMDFSEYCLGLLLGAKEFLLKESPASSQGARIRLKFYQAANFVIGWFLSLGAVWFVGRYVYARYF